MHYFKNLKKIVVDQTFLGQERGRLASYIANAPVKALHDLRLHGEERSLLTRPLFLSVSTRMISILSIILALGLGGGAVLAAQNDLPDQALYRVKLLSEKVRLSAAASADAKARLNLEFAARRAVEAEAISDAKAKVPSSVAVEVLTGLTERLQEANENALAAKAQGKAEALVDLSTNVVVTARGIDQALDRIKLKISGEVQAASKRAEAAVEATAKIGEAIRAKVNADEDASVKVENETAARASVEGKIGAAENRLKAAVNHVATVEARLGVDVVANAKEELEAARKLIADAKVKREVKAYDEAFNLAQQSIETSNEVNFSLKDSIRALLPMGFSKPESDERPSGEVEANVRAKEKVEANASIEANVKL